MTNDDFDVHYWPISHLIIYKDENVEWIDTRTYEITNHEGLEKKTATKKIGEK